MIERQQYISDWHDDFVDLIKRLQNTVAFFMQLPQATEEDKRGFSHVAIILAGKDVQDVEQDLADGDVSDSTVNKIGKIYKDLTDIALDHMSADSKMRELWKQIFHLIIDYDKQMSKKRLHSFDV